MKTKKESSESLDDLVFANRNHNYGAYEIRKSYPGFLNKAATVSIILLLIAVTAPLIASYYDQGRILREGNTVGVTIIDIAPPPEMPELPPPPPPIADLEKQTRFTAPVVVDSAEAPADPGLDALSQASFNAPVDPEIAPVIVETPSTIEATPEPPVRTYVPEMPSFPGGEEARLGFLKANLHYPALAKEINLQGTVYLSFIVDAKGKIVNVTLLRGIGSGCDEEAIRVISMMPDWNPGRQDGTAVKVKCTTQIKFTLTE